ncbi:MAG: glycoside hydrolase family 5 protein, partial [Bacteroidota bacterium]
MLITHFRFKSMIILASCFIFINAEAQDTSKFHAWWNDAFIPPPAKSPKAKLLPLIHVYKNKFVNAKGDTLLFRGLSISDPDKIQHQGHWNRNLFEKVKELGTMFIRIPVHPVAWRERTPAKYLV